MGERPSSDLRARAAFLVFGIVAAIAVAACAGASPSARFDLSTWTLLASLALLAELMPVEWRQRGIRIAFTLPFVVGIAAAMGPLPAIGADVLATALAAAAMRFPGRKQVGWVWPGLNVCTSAISAGGAGLAWQAAGAGGGSAGWGLLGAVAAYVGTYVFLNFFLVAVLGRIVHRGSLRERILQNWSAGAFSIALYGLVAVLAAFLVRTGLTAWTPIAILPVLALRHALLAQTRSLDQYYETITALSMMLQRVHPYTHGHLHRVASVAEAVAGRLGLPARRSQFIREAAILHDIGKIAIDEEVLDKPSRLTEEEFAHVKLHAAFGAQILEPVEAFQPIVRWIRHHHERPDGLGYPDQLTDQEIPIESKIIAVVDAYDAMTGGAEGKDRRAYRDPMTSAEALDELERCAGTQFDRDVVAAFRTVVVAGSRA